MERWKKISYHNRYSISTQGRVRNDKSGRILKQLLTNGYLTVALGANFKKSIHRLLAETFIPNPKNKCDVNHIDGNKTNNNLNNLEWATRSENLQHSYDNNLSKRRYGHKDSIGSKNSMARLDESKVKEIRNLFNNTTMNCTQIAKIYNVHIATIDYIVRRITWKHVE